MSVEKGAHGDAPDKSKSVLPKHKSLPVVPDYVFDLLHDSQFRHNFCEKGCRWAGKRQRRCWRCQAELSQDGQYIYLMRFGILERLTIEPPLQGLV